ncbi:uncharacterized protein [Chlorocebus sabaeus]|uniref:uncharacterized protein n=1 Tax=Chlorocebus sabaeus TaxID=60711 RepID=UPI00045E1A24
MCGQCRRSRGHMQEEAHPELCPHWPLQFSPQSHGRQAYGRDVHTGGPGARGDSGHHLRLFPGLLSTCPDGLFVFPAPSPTFFTSLCRAHQPGPLPGRGSADAGLRGLPQRRTPCVLTAQKGQGLPPSPWSPLAPWSFLPLPCVPPASGAEHCLAWARGTLDKGLWGTMSLGPASSSNVCKINSQIHLRRPFQMRALLFPSSANLFTAKAPSTLSRGG